MNILKLALAILVLISGHCLQAQSTAAGQTAPPNIVVVLVDDLGWTDLGCQGSRFYETPHIDRLAASGARFTNAYAACAVCSPTRAAVMTGRYPARVGVTDWIRARFQRGGKGTPKQNPTEYVGGRKRLLCPPNPYWMEHQELTIAEVLRGRGYRSCFIGKWHLGDEAWFPTSQGFDENYGGCDYGQPPSYFDPYTNRKLPQGIPHLPPRNKGEYLTHREADEAVGFIRRNKDRPFFLFLANYAVHTPIQAKPEVAAHYAAKRDKQDPAIRQRNPKYAAMVQSVDEAVGKVVAELETLGLRDKTLILFTSDNGGLVGPTHNAPLRSGKGYPYEGGIRVPLIANWPGRIDPGTVSHHPVCSIDLFPTITEVCKAETPTEHVIDGTSLVPHLKGLSAKNRVASQRDLIWHFPHYRGRVIPYSIIRRGDWKLIKRYEGPTFELYNLGADRGEKHDLASAKPELVKQLDRGLINSLGLLEAKMPRANPKFGSPTFSRQVDPVNRGKPRVLLLGDSISIGYDKPVRQMMRGKAAVFRPMRDNKRPENCGGTLLGVQRIDTWLKAEGGKWDVIHFNFGLHDLKRVDPKTKKNSNNPKHPHQSVPARYERQLRTIVKKLRATGASLVFATTTPVPKGVRPYRGIEDPVQYNEIAKRVMKENKIPIDDLFTFANARLAEIQQPRNVHFSPKGSRALAGEVVKHLHQALARRRR